MATTSRATARVNNDENNSVPANDGSSTSTLPITATAAACTDAVATSVTAAAAMSLGVVADAKGAAPVATYASKRALGDITNALRASSSTANATCSHMSKAISGPRIRRTGVAATKQPAAARRLKSSALAAAVSSAASSAASGQTRKTASPMATSATAPRRNSDRLAKRAAAAVSAAVQCRLDFAVAMEEKSDADSTKTDDSEALPERVIDIDKADKSCLTVSQFAGNIHRRLVEKEVEYMPDPGYMSTQKDITVKMRAILIDWLVDVHCKFRLRPETLFLTVNIIDRYLAKAPVIRRKLQLVGVTAMLIASKYEEIYAPEIADFVYISDKAYNKKEIIDMEAAMLNQLEFSVTVPYSLSFMHRCLKAVLASSGVSCELHSNLAHYMIELALPSATMLQFRPSIVAAAAVLLSGKMTRPSFQWDETMRYHSGNWSESDLNECETQLRYLVNHELDIEGTNKLTAVKRKFAALKFSNISTRVIIMMERHTCDMDICKAIE